MEALLLTAADVARHLPPAACLEAVEDAFRQLGEGRAAPPGSLGTQVDRGGFHAKAGVMVVRRRLFYAVKVNGNFPGNPVHGLPTIQGLAMLSDASDGRVLSVMDSIELTGRRTAAATALAARLLSRPRAASLALVGCGVQARHHLLALAEVLPLRRVRVTDQDVDRAGRFAEAMSAETGLEIGALGSTGEAVRGAEVVVTCTTSTRFLLQEGDVAPGTFIAGVGVDAADKRELAPGLLSSARVVTDLRAQCAAIGDLHHALDAGAMTLDGVHADLAEIVCGTRPGREGEDQVIVYDSTGIALQDVAAAAAVYLSAFEDESIRRFAFA